jgi:large subunit ribosomal protein L28
MGRICQITGARPTTGNKINRSGLAKKKGGIGRHITKRVKRWIYPNVQKKRIFVPELNEWVKVEITCRALKTIDKNGAYKTLVKAGLIKPIERNISKAAAVKAAA